MRNNRHPDRRCSYVVVVQNATSNAGELGELAAYFSTLTVAGCEVVILDPSPQDQFEVNSRVLRWVGQHLSVRPEHRFGGGIDIVRAASAHASTDKVIVAAEDVRYTPEAIAQICELLDVHEVVEPQDYLDPMPWWGGIEAGRILIHRGIEPQPDHGATFGFRRSAVRALRALGPATTADAQARRLAAVGAEVYPAADVFVRREVAPFSEWLSARPRLAGDDFDLPLKTALFFSLVPLLLLLFFTGGPRVAGSYLSVVAFTSIVLAARGRVGAAAMFFPLRACFFAPRWVFERSVSVYWALFRKLRGTDEETTRIAAPDRASGTKVASGE
jgi:hypothetical protein